MGAACTDRWVDVFVSKAADDDNYDFDDVFCATVQSIEFDPATPMSKTDAAVAYVTTNNSEWILPTWRDDYTALDAAKSPYADLKVGDLVRIGGMATQGFTDYLTIVEIKNVGYLANATNSAVTCTLKEGSGAPLPLPLPTTSSISEGGAQNSVAVAIPFTGISHIAIRVNASLNCTSLPDDALNRDITLNDGEVTHQQQILADADKLATLATRHHAYEYLSHPASAYEGEVKPTEPYYYPLYKAKNWTHGKELVARLDHGVKQVSAVKLLGYSLVNKRQVGIQHAHEMQVDDYLIMRIKEIEGHVISNNQYANGAFAILRAGDTSNTLIGAAEFSSYEPMGIVCVPVHASNTTVRNLTIEITDRRGKPAHFGRLHLWFKLLVTHG